MGLLDKFRKKTENVQPEINNKEEIDLKTFDIEYGTTTDGRLQVDFYDMQADFKQFYDTTRLIVSDNPLNLAGQEVYNCIVSWYGQNDCQMLDERTGKFESQRSRQYRGVLAQIDLNLLKSDSDYCNKVMKGLLNKKRVERYLEAGLEETPGQPCGKYIGGVRQTEKGYSKFFSPAVGKASHNSNLMIKRRQEHRARIEAAKQKAIDDKKAQIEKLQTEINDISK